MFEHRCTTVKMWSIRTCIFTTLKVDVFAENMKCDM